MSGTQALENPLSGVEWLLTTVSELQDRGYWTDPDELHEIRAEAEKLKHDFHRQQETMRTSCQTLAERLESLTAMMTRILAEMPTKPVSQPFED